MGDPRKVDEGHPRCNVVFSHTEQTKAWSERPKPGQRRNYPGQRSSSNILISCFGHFFSWAPSQLAQCAPFWFSPTFWRNVGEPPYTVCRESEDGCTWVTGYHVVHTRKVPTDYVGLNLPNINDSDTYERMSCSDLNTTAIVLPSQSLLIHVWRFVCFVKYKKKKWTVASDNFQCMPRPLLFILAGQDLLRHIISWPGHVTRTHGMAIHPPHHVVNTSKLHTYERVKRRLGFEPVDHWHTLQDSFIRM